MYQWIVKRQVRDGFEAISTGNFDAVTSKFAPDIHFTFAGNHAMYADFHSRTLAAQWFERVHRLFPDLKLSISRIAVAGLPWDMTVTTKFHVGATLPDKTPYINEGVQILRIKMGKIVEDHLIEDTAALNEALHVVAASGNQEALAQPIH